MADLLTFDAPSDRGDTRPPTKITAFRTNGADPQTFASLEDLGRWLHKARGRLGMKVSAVHASYDGSDTFPAFNVYTLDDAGVESWACTVATPGTGETTLMAAVAATNPHAPNRRAA